MTVPAVEAGGAAAENVTAKRTAKKAAARRAPAARPARARPAPVDGPLDLSGGEFAAKNRKLEPPTSGALRRGNPRHVLIAEFLICMVVLAAGTIVPTPKSAPQEGVPHLMVKGSGLSLLFFVLALVSAGGDRGAKAAAGIGGLITVGYLLTSQDAHNTLSWITAFYSKPGTAGAGVPTDGTVETSLVEYTPAVPYPWVTPDVGAPAPAGPPAQVTA